MADFDLVSIAESTVDDAPFRVIAEHLPSLCWLAGPDGYIFWYNRRWYDYTGTSAAEMAGWGWQSVHDPERLPGVLERWKRSIETGAPFEMLFPLRGADGVFREFLTRIEPIRGADGAIERWLGTNTDVSRQQSVERALRQASARNEALVAEQATILEQLAEGVIVTDADGRISFVNAAAERMHGGFALDVAPDEYSSAYNLFTEAGDPYPSAELPLARAVRGETVSEARWQIRREHDAVLAVGSAAPIRGPGGERLGAVLTLRDETARDAAERAVRENEAMLRAFFETAGLYFAVLDLEEADFRFVLTNPRMARFWGSDDLVGRSAREVAGGALPAGAVETLQRGYDAGTATTIEYPYRADGRKRWFLATLNPMPAGPSGTPRLAFASLDITGRKAAEAALGEAVEAKDTLLHEVNHRVKNSLQLVTSLLTLQAAQITDPALKQSMLDARTRVGVVASIHQRLYSASQHDRVDFTAYLEEMCRETLAATSGRSDVLLRFAASDAPVILLVDKAVPLALVVSELVTNAIKYAFADAGGTIDVRLERTSGALAVTVADDGAGLPEGFDIARSRGLGMKIVRSLMKQLRGEVAIETVGGGTVFRLTVPLASLDDEHITDRVRK